MNGLDDFLKGIQPELNDDGFDPLKGMYRVVIKNEEKAETGFIIGKFPNGEESRRFQISCDVADVLAGNGSAGRRVWLRYNEDEKGIKKLVNDLFTAGLLEKVDKSSVDSLKSTLPDIAGSVVYLKAWHWTPEVSRDGKPLAESERRSIQQGQFVTEKVATKAAKKSDENPF